MSAPIAPAPANGSRSGAAGHSSHPSMAYSCQTCARRKVKCDKTTPTCSSCRKGRLECIYQAPAPRARKRKPGEADGDDLHERLARYERVLRQHGLLEAADDEMERIADKSKAEDDDDNDAVDAENRATGTVLASASDPLTGATLFQYHPTHAEAMALWATYVENVEPILEILHIPSMAKMIETTSQQPALASKDDRCLLFAVYHFAVVSMSDEECRKKLGTTPRVILIQRFNLATRQALVNASFLSTTAMAVLQALVLFLVACRHDYDPSTYWILTGVAARIAQRMGLHRDGEALGLPPFDVQMRRRLFFQILPLDGAASRMAGTAVSMPDSWDTRQPLNIDNEQIWPDMTEAPQAREGATDMIFCLSRSYLGTFFAKTGKAAEASQPLNGQDSERTIKEAEREVEERYIRYCDIVNPLHMLTISSARAGITATRLRVRLQKVKSQTATTTERKELFHLAQEILDTDAAARAYTGLNRYWWHTRWFFLWGTWDSLMYILMTLWQRGDLFSSQEGDAAWERLEELCRNHSKLVEPKRPLYVAFGRLMVKAWDAGRASGSSGKPEPSFIRCCDAAAGLALRVQ
ncbi:hypothetical protein ACHAQH_005479 [Verticillium albo-atrum]